MQVCLHCGSANSKEAKKCYQCGTALAFEEEASDFVGTEEDLEFPTNCKYCDHPVEPEQERCPNCQAILVSADPLDRPCPRSHDRETTERYQEIAQQVQALRDESLDIKDFEGWLNNLQQDLLYQRERYVALIKNSNYWEEGGEDEVNLFVTGVFEYEEGIEKIYVFLEVEGSDYTLLDEALKIIWEGNVKVNEALRLNREARAKLEDDWGFM